MNRVYVLEQAFTCASEKFQLKFAEEASAKLGTLPGIKPEATGKALLLHAGSELSLDAAGVTLGACYGEDLRPGPRLVRQLDNPPMEPIMDVLVRAPKGYGEKIYRDLHRRRAVLRFKNIEEHGCLLRVEAPMAELLGYRAALSTLTGDLADHWITFNRWEPVKTGDGGGSAA